VALEKRLTIAACSKRPFGLLLIMERKVRAPQEAAVDNVHHP